ncbi:hypothetical protein [Rhizobium sp.]|jgi:hypothetical protein|uniref:hypothetical protein n=1 Tax=Rhizobium sp. TaxID=391 RepID=UPI000E88F38C|nr:hypothetical protein [Rhizobium sp.]
MKTVTLTKDLRPWRAGDDIHVEDDVAKSLIASKEAKSMRPFSPTGYQTREMSADENAGRQNYRIKAVESGFRAFSAKLAVSLAAPSLPKKQKAKA